MLNKQNDKNEQSNIISKLVKDSIRITKAFITKKESTSEEEKNVNILHKLSKLLQSNRFKDQEVIDTNLRFLCYLHTI
jgi:predicted choloylglycine hydrolase